MCVCVCVCVWGRREEEERYPGSQRYFLVTELGQQMQNAIPLRSIKWAIGLIYNVSLTGVSQWEWNQSLVVLWGEDLFMQTFHRHLISGPRNLRPIRFRIRFQRSIQHILQHALLSLSFFFFFLDNQKVFTLQLFSRPRKRFPSPCSWWPCLLCSERGCKTKSPTENHGN